MRTLGGLGLAFALCLPAACSRQTADDPPPATVPLPADPYEAGKVEATRDVRNGLLVEKTYGRLPAWVNTYGEVLKTNYHVELRIVPSEELSISMIERIRGYNEVSVPEIERRFGAGVLKQAAQLAEQSHPNIATEASTQ
ncbi:MAG: hypothetical protein AB1705_17305 [Verrucomicrobiota bacterium]